MFNGVVTRSLESSPLGTVSTVVAVLPLAVTPGPVGVEVVTLPSGPAQLARRTTLPDHARKLILNITTRIGTDRELAVAKTAPRQKNAAALPLRADMRLSMSQLLHSLGVTASRKATNVKTKALPQSHQDGG